MSVARNIDQVINEYDALQVPGLRLMIQIDDILLWKPTDEILNIFRSSGVNLRRLNNSTPCYLGSVKDFNDALGENEPGEAVLKLLKYKQALAEKVLQGEGVVVEEEREK